ncbi:hypothetical protein PBT90_13550 [Algoriphagus halophytocola]|uniref:DoxX family protein n=1 Tax=Algoriphagus halophytocola TaxID=2991499 RepID=A0ABY6MMM7_9BACT|nr:MULTISPECIES: hypothetical protein [unclassified Algoriphagus]UZD24415.1 hypothetical protein OM944_07905 [Algoriphagus sp. TR-M5]WBL41779.1 hypothetical protein PBT90_13550 [Algoriphagus sp. TR-M9]
MKRIPYLSIQAISIFLGFTFWGSGMAKLFYEHQFFGWIGPVWLIEELEPYGLGLYGKFIALSQITIGYMLVTTRYKLLGSIMMLPLIGNILMVTISLQWKGTPFVLGFLLLLDLILLWQYRDFFRPLIDEGKSRFDIKPRKIRTRNGHLVWLAGLALQFFAIQVSYWNWPAACGVVLMGLLLSGLSFKVNRMHSILDQK